MATETETRVGVYEAMFLANQAAAASFGDLLVHINKLFERADAEVIAMKKWDERRLSYEIDKQKRGVYILAYFKCPTDMVAHLERDVQISDQLLRVLITSAEHLTDEEIAVNDDRTGLDTEAKLKAEQGDTQQAEGSSKARLGAPEQEQQARMAQAEASKSETKASQEAQPEDAAPSDDEGGESEPDETKSTAE
ncbi:MAG: 30S ribosomal protein S6 [Phycisphaerales bacterium]